MVNVQAYYDTATIMGENSLIVQAPGVSVKKLIMVAIFANNRLWWKWTAVANTPAYYDTATIIGEKSWIVHTPGVSVKTFYGRDICKY